MRRRLAVWSLAVTALVVVAFTVPLAFLVRRQAVDRAQVAAERDAQATAVVVTLAAGLAEGSETTTGDELGPSAIADAIGNLPGGEIVLLPGGTTIGDTALNSGRLAAQVYQDPEPVPEQAYLGDGWELAVPVFLNDGTAVVSVFVPNDTLTEGVAKAWLLLALLGVVIVLASVLVADSFGKRLVSPLGDLAEAATRLGEGDLGTRVEVGPPEEIEELGLTFNWLADRLTQLLAEERESVADLSHRLRTPLTGLRLQAERITDPDDRAAILAQSDRLEEAVDRFIEETRQDRYRAAGRCDLGSVVASRADFWRVLADEQGRQLTVELGSHPAQVLLPEDSVAAVVDALIENVFSHTPEGTPFGVRVVADRPTPALEVWDQGPGFPSADALIRGISGGGSTGLGLDIARRTAETGGGGMELNDRPGGGAVVRVWFG